MSLTPTRRCRARTVAAIMGAVSVLVPAAPRAEDDVASPTPEPGDIAVTLEEHHAAPPTGACGDRRPRIGLVLAGGGARGTAHVGVLEILEELRIPVGCVAGTSMGAVVGGLYASGRSPTEMHDILANFDWAAAFKDASPRKYKAFRRKEDQRTFLSKIRVGFKDGRISFPAGFIQGQWLQHELNALTMPVYDVNDFDQLPVPFRAVATDATDGSAVILRSGNLSKAMRASMAIPAIFAPVELDGRTLVDGGVVMNLPVQVVQDMGADLVIAVDVGTKIGSRGTPGSAFSVGGQAMTISLATNTEESRALLGDDDVLIEPDLEGVGTGSFYASDRGVVQGQAATRILAERLAPLSVDEATWAEYLASHRTPDRPPPVVSRIRFMNGSKASDRALRGRIQTEEGEPLDLPRLKADLARLYGLDIFDLVESDLVPRDDGTVELVIRGHERALGRNLVGTGIDMGTDFVGRADFDFSIRLTRLPVNGWLGEWRTTGGVGTISFGETEFFQPLDPKGITFFAPRGFVGIRQIDVYEDLQQIGTVKTFRAGVGFDVGISIGNWAQIRGGMSYTHGDNTDVVGDATQIPGAIPDFDIGAYRVGIGVDTWDHPIFPTSGWLGYADFIFERRYLGGDVDTDIFTGEINWVTSYRNTRLILGFEGGLPLNNENPDRIDRRIGLGGFLRLSGLAPRQEAGVVAVLGRAVIYRPIATPRIMAFEIPVYLGASVETGAAWDTRAEADPDQLLWSGSAFVGLDTILGPVFFSYGYTRGNFHQVNLSIGQRF